VRRLPAWQTAPYAGRVSRGAFSGSWLGHPLHPLATDAVIGSWAMAALLDVRSRRGFDEAAKRLVGVGVVAAIPTAASGISDWAETADSRVRRMGLGHAASNVLALALNAGSFVARRSGRRAAGARLTAASALPLTIGGFLSAHLAYARSVGVSRTAFDEHFSEWIPIDAADPLHEGWSEASVRSFPVLTQLGEGRALRVVSARCTHCGAYLRRDEGDGRLRCAADGSVFRADDGGVLEGPATTPIPVFEARPTATGIEVRSPGAPV
jgi:nitrite reductase/ring-hydroxylating ferredoxin subunit/uncharacterized membrane protein